MFQVQQISTQPRQEMTIILPDGTSVFLSIYFVPMQYGWFVTELTYGSFTLTGLRITNSPNMLQQFRNQIPFGLACFSLADREPSQQQDFQSGASNLYILTQDEVAEYTRFLASGA